MTMSFAETFKDINQDDEFLAELAMLEFTTQLSHAIKAKGLSKSDLARSMGVSPAYITKVFRGNANLSIQSMVKLARCAGMKFQPNLVNPKPVFAEVIQLRPDIYHTAPAQKMVASYGR